jgi:hypothetical protein
MVYDLYHQILPFNMTTAQPHNDLYDCIFNSRQIQEFSVFFMPNLSV